MDPQSTEHINELRSQLIAVMNTPVGISKAMAKIDKKLTPILESLLTYYPTYQSELAFKHLFDWLIHPRRIVEEFIYVLGPLVHYVKRKYTPCSDPSDLSESDLDEEGKWFADCGFNYNKKRIRDMYYVGLAALEVIAVKCPILEGQREITAWLIIKIMYGDNICLTSRVSNHLSAWLIHIIGDADVCPNANLRIELIELLNMVSISSFNITQIFNATMDACCNLSYDYLKRNVNGCSYCDFKSSSCPHYDLYYSSDSDSDSESVSILMDDNYERRDNQRKYNGCSKICFGDIVTIFNELIQDKDMLTEFSMRLVDKMENVNSSRLSSIVHDVAYSCGLNPNKYTEPRELHSIIALLNTTAEYAQEEFCEVERQKYNYSMYNRKVNAIWMFEILIIKFRICYKIPQLIFPTASFIINIMEFIFTSDFYRSADGSYDNIPIQGNLKDSEDYFIPRIEDGLQELLIGSCSKTLDSLPIGLELISRYGSRLKMLKDLCSDFDTFPAIFSVMKHV